MQQVQFNLVCKESEEFKAQALCLRHALGMSADEAASIVDAARRARSKVMPFPVRMTLSQFALWLINRDKLDLKNGFKELAARLVSAEQSTVLDLTLQCSSSKDTG